MTTTTRKPKRITMSAAREQAIYSAVHNVIMDLRIVLQREHRATSTLDEMLSKAGDRAGIAAIRAAGGEGK